MCLTAELRQSALGDGDAHSVQHKHKPASDDLSVLLIKKSVFVAIYLCG